MNQFTDPDSGGIQQFQHCPIPQSFRRPVRRLTKKQIHFLHRQNLWHLFFYLGRMQMICRIIFYEMLLIQILEKRTHGSYASRYRRRCKMILFQIQHIRIQTGFRDILYPGNLMCFLKILHHFPQISLIGHHRIAGHSFCIM